MTSYGVIMQSFSNIDLAGGRLHVKTLLIIAVIHTTKAVVILKRDIHIQA